MYTEEILQFHTQKFKTFVIEWLMHNFNSMHMELPMASITKKLNIETSIPIEIRPEPD